MSARKQSDILNEFFNGLDHKDLSPLSRKEEVELAKKIEKGNNAEKELNQKAASLTDDEIEELLNIVEHGKKALYRLMMSCLKWMIKIAKRHIGRYPGFTFSDLLQEGSIGLMAAAKKFDWRMKSKFSTYAF